jgi:rubredoxin
MKITCRACDYTYEKDYHDPTKNKGDEEFLHLHQQFYIKTDYDGPVSIRLYVCPKCGNVVSDL